jgi:hypothetical protein
MIYAGGVSAKRGSLHTATIFARSVFLKGVR